MIKSVQAWVIHKQWSGDTSARVLFFTRELGLVNCLCKGGRTPKKQSLLQSFTPLWVDIDVRYEHYYTRSIESIAPTFHLTGTALFSSLYINELLYHALKPLDADSSLFDAYLTTLTGLAATQERFIIEALLRRFEWTLLQVCGYTFSLTHVASTGDLILADQFYQFLPGEGFIAQQQGISGNDILALAQNNLNDLASLKAAKTIMRQAIDHLLGGRIIKARALCGKA